MFQISLRLKIPILEFNLPFFGRCSLQVRYQLRNERAPVSKPDSTEDPPCLVAKCMLNLTWVKRPPIGRKLSGRVALSGVVLVT
ncbi:hypothetical protein AVEN_70610-1 [Araneus ventricosus]|uniref:Uncharacterized protein n=1 Tax=Araneus ventricosus TaxID=182803 RepID=A0A4Y2CGW1_ARAVE|nr:hypothetical protein AVEN_70610-1 [Araneus ventricosus]